MPASMPRAERRLPFSELVSRYEGRADVKRVTPASVKKYLGSIQALLGFAFQERFLPANVAAGIKSMAIPRRVIGGPSRRTS